MLGPVGRRRPRSVRRGRAAEVVRLSEIGEPGALAEPPGSGWLDRRRQVRFIVLIPSREVRRRPHTVPSWRAAVNGEPRRKGTGSHRVGASTERPADTPLTSRRPCEPREYRRCRSLSRTWAGRRRAIDTAHRRSWSANASTVAASAGWEPRVWCSGIPWPGGPSAGRGTRAWSCAPAPALSGRVLPRVAGSDACGVPRRRGLVAGTRPRRSHS